MDAKRYRQIRQLFDAVMEQPAAQRPSYLAEAGHGDTALRDEVQRLLAASDGRTELFERPVIVREGPGPLERWEGRRLGPYQILRELGEGGMGIVYLARRADGAFQKEVAIKIVRQELATSQFLERFQRERDILAKLEHPNIARLLDGGTEPAFLAMEYVKGEPLLTFADSRKLPYDARLELLRQITSAVGYAHKQGVIHRDLKPANVFVTSDGEVKLLDFGIAAWQQADSEAELSPTLAMSPAYASPEQLRGDRTNHSTDIYSLGLIAYELLAGVQPFQLKEAAIAEILRTVLEETPLAPSVAVRESTDPRPAELSRRRQIAPIDLISRLEQADGTLLKAVSKRREDRPLTASEFMDGLAKPALSGRKPRPAWVMSFRRNLDVIACELVFLWLVATGQLNLQPVAWFAFAVISFMAVSQRFGLATKLFQQSPTVVGFGGQAVVFVLGGWFLNRPEAGSQTDNVMSGLTLVLVLMLLFGSLYLHRYLRRSSNLGDLLISTKGRGRPRVFLMIVLAVQLADLGSEILKTGIGAQERFRRLAIPATMIFSMWLSLLPFEVRQKGVLIAGTVVPWTAIRGYRWIDSSKLSLLLHESEPMYLTKEMRATIQPDDRHRIQALLQDWLLELP